MMAVGHVSGRYYRFNYPGAILDVDPETEHPSQRF
jgi:hypothetical protein